MSNNATLPGLPREIRQIQKSSSGGQTETGKPLRSFHQEVAAYILSPSRIRIAPSKNSINLFGAGVLAPLVGVAFMSRVLAHWYCGTNRPKGRDLWPRVP